MNRLSFYISVIIVAFCVFIPGSDAAARQILAAVRPLAAQNAYDALYKAALPVKQDGSRMLTPIDRVLPDFSNVFTGITTEQAKKIIESNAPALSAMRRALRLPFIPPPLDSPWDTAAEFPKLASSRTLARCLMFDARYDAKLGNWGGAMGDTDDSLALASKVSRNGRLIETLIAGACGAIGRSTAWGLVDHLNTSQCHDSATKIERLQMVRPPFADVIRREESVTVASLLGSAREAKKDLYQPHSPAAKPAGASGNELDMQVAQLRLMIARYQAGTDHAIQRARLPYYEAMRGQETMLPRRSDSVPMVGLWSQSYFKTTVDDAYTQLLMTMLALRAYRLQHGTYPLHLAQLAPKYLSRVPADPFAPNRTPLKYGLTGKTYLLYSIGPDGKDDGGRTFASPQLPTFKRYLQQSNLGDIVAGVNRG